MLAVPEQRWHLGSFTTPVNAGIIFGGIHDDQGSPVPRRGIWGWMLFDWAAQPFFTVVTTFIFGPYFVSRMASDPAAGQAAWGYGVAAAGFVIAILSPVLGSIADQTGRRSRGSGFFAVIKIVSLSCFGSRHPDPPDRRADLLLPGDRSPPNSRSFSTIR